MSQAKHAEARELMYNGALLFFSYNQVHYQVDFLCVCVCVRQQFPWIPTCTCYMLTLFIKIKFINRNALVCVLILK